MGYMNRSTERLPVRDAFTRVLWLVLFIALLSACSGLTTIYYRLDWWAGPYIDDFVELNKNQRAQFQRAFKTLHRQHCERDIPRYIEILSDVRLRGQRNGLTRDYLSKQLDSLRDQWHFAIEEIAPAVASILVTLDAGQIGQLSKNFTRANREYEERYGATAEKRERARRRAFEKRLRYWLGELTPEQEEMLDHWQQNWAADEALAVASRQRWQSELITLLERSNESVEANIAKWLREDYRRYRSQEYQAVRKANEALTLDTLAGILATLTSDQKNYFIEAIDTWVRRLQSIDCARIAANN